MPGTTGVCCDHECQGGPCDACTRALTGSTQDGQCGNVLSLMDQGPQACSPAEAPATCGRTGYCDGKGQCAFYPKGMVVGDPICRWNDGGPGVASVTQSCDGVGGCICDAFTCISGMCMDGVCLPSPDAGDSGDASIGTGEDAPGDATQDVSSAEDGGDAGSDASPKTVSCAPYAGEPGHCLKECRTQADCVAPAKCHVDGTCGPGFPGERCWLNGEAGVFLPDGGCVPGSPDDPPEVVGVCSMTSRRHGASNAPWVLAALLGIWRARRRRSIPV